MSHDNLTRHNPTIIQCPRCFNSTDFLHNWCPTCGFLLLGSDQDPRADISTFAYAPNFMTTANQNEFFSGFPVQPGLLLDDPSNIRHRYASGPINPAYDYSMLAQPGIPFQDPFQQMFYATQQSLPQRQKFVSESAYDNDLEHMRNMLNNCFAGQTFEAPKQGQKWISSATPQPSRPDNAQKNRAKGRSCSRLKNDSTKSFNRSRPPSASNILPDTEPLVSPFQLETDFCCSLGNTAASRGWQNLPPEMWFRIMSYLDYGDRAHLAMTCRRLASLVRDRSLWKRISLHHRQSIKDVDFQAIGKLRPRQLHMQYCKAPFATLTGINLALRQIGDSLTHLSFIGCSKGLFDNDTFLLRAVDHCPNLQHIDASYAYCVRDQTVIYVAKRVRHLRSLLLNGAQLITINAIRNLVRFQSASLERLELFGCFKLNSDIFCLLSTCLNLRALSFGHLHHLSASGLLDLVAKMVVCSLNLSDINDDLSLISCLLQLPNLSSLDLRGTMKLLTDANLTRLADHCPLLEEFVLANMRAALRESSMAEMLRRLQRLKVLDLCGVLAVGDLAMEVLAASCPDLQELDVSCTSVTEAGLERLSDSAPASLHTLKLSYCKVSSIDVFQKLVRSCPKLTKLVAYGYEQFKDWNEVQKQANGVLDIETEQVKVEVSQTGTGNGRQTKAFRPVPLDKS
ncbi:hypothetical protein Ciccas_011534 [Cichlidogyrus casuarinus]|uniref:F-box domain-containing protein n=1 Tax=Cichlidogyrus casuarinus TaxID=1844966 RepID=A0ABD2PTX6_9PLAT